MINEDKIVFPDISLKYKVWFSSANGEGIMGDGKWLLLKEVSEHGSLKAAADALDISYRKAWGDLKKIEKFLSFKLIEKHRGGANGGNTIITEQGKAWIKAYDLLHNEIEKNIDKAYSHFVNNTKKIFE